MTAVAVGFEALESAGVLYKGLGVLGGGAILSGLVIGAIVVFLIDRRPKWAAAYAAAGAVLSFFGFIHSPAVGFAVSPGIAIGYLLMAALCFAFSYLSSSQPQAQEEGIEAIPTG